MKRKAPGNFIIIRLGTVKQSVSREGETLHVLCYPSRKRQSDASTQVQQAVSGFCLVPCGVGAAKGKRENTALNGDGWTDTSEEIDGEDVRTS